MKSKRPCAPGSRPVAKLLQAGKAHGRHGASQHGRRDRSPSSARGAGAVRPRRAGGSRRSSRRRGRARGRASGSARSFEMIDDRARHAVEVGAAAEVARVVRGIGERRVDGALDRGAPSRPRRGGARASPPTGSTALGFARRLPAMSGALPCTASNTAQLSPRFAPGTTPSPPTRPGAQVGEDVAVEVLEQQHVELRRVLHELHAAVVDDDLAVADPRMIARHAPRALEEEPVRELQDVRLVDGADLAAPFALGEREGVARDPQRGAPRSRP